MKQNILNTKLQRPPVAPDIVPRARLLHRLNAGRQGPLTLISAPAGYGKSTLASRWVAVCDGPSGWLSLGEGDGDLRVFLNYLLAAVRPLFPHMAFRSEALLEAVQMPAAADVASELLNDLHGITTPFIMVLDDYHCIGDTPVQDLMAALLAHPSQSMHLALVTRHDPALPLATLRGRGQMTEIRAADLRFTAAEAGAFLTNMLNVAVDDATAALLDAKTEGWATGLRLAGLYLRDKTDLSTHVRQLSGNSRHIAEYLVAEVLSRQEPELLTCLMETSLLDRFCAPLCRAIHAGTTQNGKEQAPFDAQRFIQWMVAANLFVIPLDDQGHWFRYHHLFQAFLQARLRRQLRPEDIDALHRRAGQWFADNDLPDEALGHALAAGDIQMVVQLVLEHRYELMNSTQFFRLQNWMTKLPDTVVVESPLLASARAFVGIELGQDTQVYHAKQQAEQALIHGVEKSRDYDALKAEVGILNGFMEMIMGDPGIGITHTNAALKTLPKNALLIRSLGMLTLAGCHQMMGDPGLSVKTVQGALADPIWSTNLRARLYFYLAIALYMQADLTGAMAASRACLREFQDFSFTHTRTFALYLLGKAHYWRNELDQAEAYLREVLELYQAANPSYVANSGFILAHIHVLRDEGKEADRILTRINHHFQKNRFTTVQAMTQAFQIELAIRRGEIRRAGHLGDTFDFDLRPPIWFYYVPQLTSIKLLLAKGTKASLASAHTRLAELDEQMKRIHRNSVRIDVLALQALVCRQSGDEAAALEHLRSALALAEPGGWIRNFIDLGAPMQELLHRRCRVASNDTYARQVLAAFEAQALSNTVAGPDSDTSKGSSGHPGGPALTPREIEFLALLEEGLSNKQISERLHIAYDTVKTHLQNIYGKLKTNNRLSTVKKAHALGLVKRR